MGNLPKVSVVMITYAHEKFIEQAINGILMQDCDFEVELIIANDCSPDKTDAIVQNIIATHPRATCIKYTKHEINLGMMPNFVFALKQAKGSYIALCEGDDYWTDKTKLQKQVYFLENNKDFSISFHNVKIINENEPRSQFLSNLKSQKEVTTIMDLAIENFIYTTSCVFRNNLKNTIPAWFNNLPLGDYPLHMLNAQFGKIKYHQDVMAVYRIHNIGVWGANSNIINYPQWIKLIELIRQEFAPEIQYLLNMQIIKLIKVLLNDEVLSDQKKRELYFKVSEIFSSEELVKQNFKLQKKLDTYQSIKFLFVSIIYELASRIGFKNRNKQIN